jgi:asparagine synthase (glutamine-hydrolysing)
VPVGVFFSGGIDSSLISCILHKHHQDLKTFTINMKHKSQDEYYADEIVSLCDIQQQKTPFTMYTFDSLYHTITQYIDEPFYDSSLFPTYYVSHIASQDTKVVLSGE